MNTDYLRQKVPVVIEMFSVNMSGADITSHTQTPYTPSDNRRIHQPPHSSPQKLTKHSTIPIYV